MTVPTSPRDPSRLLHDIVAGLRAIGLAEEASEFERRCFAAYTTGSEWLGEVGLAIRQLRASARAETLAPIQGLLDECAIEVSKVWPNLQSGASSSIRRLERP